MFELHGEGFAGEFHFFVALDIPAGILQREKGVFSVLAPGGVSDLLKLVGVKHFCLSSVDVTED